jgi:hypothetical protein
LTTSRAETIVEEMLNTIGDSLSIIRRPEDKKDVDMKKLTTKMQS